MKNIEFYDFKVLNNVPYLAVTSSDTPNKLTIYKWGNHKWVKQGNELSLDIQSAFVGCQVLINDRGDKFLITVEKSKSNGHYVRTYEYSNNAWLYKSYVYLSCDKFYSMKSVYSTKHKRWFICTKYRFGNYYIHKIWLAYNGAFKPENVESYLYNSDVYNVAMAADSKGEVLIAAYNKDIDKTEFYVYDTPRVIKDSYYNQRLNEKKLIVEYGLLFDKNGNLILLSESKGSVDVTIIGSFLTSSYYRNKDAVRFKLAGLVQLAPNYYLINAIDTAKNQSTLVTFDLKTLENISFYDNVKWNVYPVPFSSYLNVSIKNKGVIKMYDLNGALVKVWDVNGGLNQIETNSLKTGMYVLVLYNERGIEIARRKIMK